MLKPLRHCLYNACFSSLEADGPEPAKSDFKKEAQLKREEERKKSIELMKKKWLSQYKSLGVNRAGPSTSRAGNARVPWKKSEREES